MHDELIDFASINMRGLVYLIKQDSNNIWMPHENNGAYARSTTVLWTQGKIYDVWMHHEVEHDFTKLTKLVSYFSEFSTIYYEF